MLKSLSEHVSKPSTFRRLLFASVQLPSDCPNFWDVVVRFATKEHTSKDTITAQEAKVLIENLHDLDEAAFETDEKLTEEILKFKMKSKPLGVVLISSNSKCNLCKSKLMLRKDRPSSVFVYDKRMGTLPGSHFHKYCTNRSCTYVQYYGYYSSGGESNQVYYNDNWESLPYFVSSRETVFSMTLLNQFNAEILFGQLSFKQCADIYNFLHNYLGETGESW